ncbi:hypothetical protein DFH06DRAFT_1305196, partial [Mycena polygramma]
MAPLYFHTLISLLVAGLSLAAVPSVLITAPGGTLCTASTTTSISTITSTSTNWSTIILTSTETDSSTIILTSTVTLTTTPTSMTAPTSTGTSTTTCDAAAPTTTSWTYLGCYPDNVNDRTLNGYGETDWTTNTVENCQATCSARGFAYAGVEFGVQCFCASSIKSGVNTGGTCNMACTGGGGTCGGSSTIDIYKAVKAPCATPWKYLGCYSDNVSARTLNGYGEIDTGPFRNSAENCQATCLARGFVYAGVEDGSQCFCGLSIGSGGTIQDEGHCQMPCSGGVGTCGGAPYLGIYKAAV